MTEHQRSQGPPQSEDVSCPNRQYLDERLLAYTLAGTGALALGPAAHAQIVYTPTDITIPYGATLQIDLNNDGTYDFNLVNKYSSFCFTDGGGPPNCTFAGEQDFLRVNGNGNRGAGVVGGTGGANALPYGKTIGPPLQNDFTRVEFASRNMACESHSSSARGTFSHNGFSGRFLNVNHKFLGLRFVFDNQLYYGWAELSVTSGVSATLMGYAYQSTPNTAITARDTGPDASVQPEAGRTPSVHLLSMGREGVRRFRQQKREAGQKPPFSPPCG